MSTHKVAIIGSGNIGTDLLLKILRVSDALEVAAFVGIDPESDGLSRARRLGVATTSDGVEGLLRMPGFDEIDLVFDATSAKAHLRNDEVLRATGVRVVDLTPAAIGPLVVPPVNLAGLAHSRNVNMVTCGGQATIPIVAAINAVAPVRYAEIVASISSRSAGPGTRANIDEFTETTSRAIEVVGGAARGKAVIILNPAEPPMIMRDTVYCLAEGITPEGARAAVDAMVTTVRTYVRGYRLKQEVQCRRLAGDDPLLRLCAAEDRSDISLVSVFLEVEGAGDYLPAYAGNLDIMTAAALHVGESLVRADRLETAV
ncbi:acetaldehyde dehydrogenase (acetylating) [Streptomyces radicis]|uniref:Acetaldehyde dehydrogenase n=1 Tax=Streptomyces radicis TaxID=1750517 RepID=A0A3A9WIG5_9ACTN|nr:acetaldehyde dehydrogenase (acetylating) [Streptomyces radicis]RKN12818.1 acetaldehyde dehydrogenase (acetylating) [Streptomyces radicis]RKN27417.1 acetaldehyde dehydrogenase (acetylating) [Streptomyces radicis]